MPRATVAVPAYNSSATIERCLRSALRQTLRDIEVLVADDASLDDTAAIAERLATEDGRLRVVRLGSNAGKPAAMNRLVREARGGWVAVLDADDAFREDRLEHLIRAAEEFGADMAADNLLYIDGVADQAVRTAFDPAQPPRVVGKQDFLRHSDSYAEFDFGILKPVMRRSFLEEHGLTYYEGTRLAEDYYYLLGFFLAGGRGVLLGTPSYYWTMPFGTLSRQWTRTGAGAWRYDYRQALAANEHFIAALSGSGDVAVLRALAARSRQYRVMAHYLDAQRALAEGGALRSARIVLAHPSTWGLLLRRVAGRVARRLRKPPSGPGAPAIPHPAMDPDAPRKGGTP